MDVDDDYPSDEDLRQLEDWPYQDVNGALDFIKSKWHWGEEWCNHTISAAEAVVLRADPSDTFLRCATGGWSGNESLIAAFRGDSITWDDKDRKLMALLRYGMTWRLSAVGGLHIFRYMPRTNEG